MSQINNFKYNRRPKEASYWSYLKDNDYVRSLITFQLKSGGITQKQAAGMINTYQNHVSNYVNNKGQGLSDYQILLLAERLGVEIDINAIIKKDAGEVRKDL